MGDSSPVAACDAGHRRYGCSVKLEWQEALDMLNWKSEGISMLPQCIYRWAGLWRTDTFGVVMNSGV